MSLTWIKTVTSVLMAFSMVSVGGPLLGEIVATSAPIFTRRDSLSVKALNLTYETISFLTSDQVTLRGWFFPAERKDAPAILYAPATSQDLRSGISLVSPLHEAGYHVLLFSYRGHGFSDGNRFGFTYGALESVDVDAAVRYLSEEREIERIGGIGHSAGAVSLILSAARNPTIDVVIAASPFTNVEDVWETNRPVIFPKPMLEMTMSFSELRKGFSRDEVRPEDVIAQIAPRPFLLIHGSEDKRVTEAQAMRLYAAAKGPKQMWIVDGASHAEVRRPVLDEMVGDIIQFFNGALLESAL
jgi:dipeptidyl aminopeptidase/acylaminoacyl peptidase